MAIQLINIGNVANDGTGDDLREAMIKINQNFEELDLRDDEQTTASNIGFGGVGLFSNKINYNLQFKSLNAGNDVTITEANDLITINASGGVQTLTLQSDVNSTEYEDDAIVKIVGGDYIDTVIIDGGLRVNYTGPTRVQDDPTPQLAGSLDANLQNITNAAIISANRFEGNFVGNLNGTVHGIDVRNINSTEFDFGSTFAGINVTTALNWFLYLNDVDYGSFSNPTPVQSDFGTFV